MIVDQIVRELDLLDLDPLRVYESVKNSDSYILQSAEGGEKVARYSFIGFNPAAKLSIKDDRIDLMVFDPNIKELRVEGGDPLNVMRNLISQFELKGGVGSRFAGGFVGYLAYDIVRHYIQLGDSTEDTLKQPDCEFILAKNNITFDHMTKKAYVISNVFSEGSVGDEEDKLEEIVDSILNLEFESEKPGSKRGKLDFESNMSEREFMSAVEKTVEYIRRGDILQAVLSQRLSTTYARDPFLVYKTLKEINPSPYMYYLDLGERTIVGSSPEMLTRVEGRTVMTYPIAGTRSRGRNISEDRRLEEEMVSDGKERAEHLMLVDLGRNDIGRVAEFGSVRVKKLMAVEKYSHVQHMVSEVTGTLREGRDEFDALESIFPAGTVSGAPKVRAMEIIEELEPTRRGVYAGCVGYFSFNRNMDTAITIRTLVFEDGMAYAQAGAGVVADSKPRAEYKETLKKAKALLTALEYN